MSTRLPAQRTPELAPYPAGWSPPVGAQLAVQRQSYLPAAERLLAEIREAEAVMADLLDREDRLASTRDRLTALASYKRVGP